MSSVSVYSVLPVIVKHKKRKMQKNGNGDNIGDDKDKNVFKIIRK